jgi:hypothetical protein
LMLSCSFIIRFGLALCPEVRREKHCWVGPQILKVRPRAGEDGYQAFRRPAGLPQSREGDCAIFCVSLFCP